MAGASTTSHFSSAAELYDPPRLKTARARFAEQILTAVEGGEPEVRERLQRAFEIVPRHLFIDRGLETRAYEDVALPIDAGQTISRPSTVALMLLSLGVKPAHRVLEVGAGSGYATALLAAMGADVLGLEYHRVLAEQAAMRLRSLGLTRATVKCGDGLASQTCAAFDSILVSAAISSGEHALLSQLKPNGRAVMPLRETTVRARHSYPSHSERQRLVLYLGRNSSAIDLGECTFVLAA